MGLLKGNNLGLTALLIFLSNSHFVIYVRPTKRQKVRCIFLLNLFVNSKDYVPRREDTRTRDERRPPRLWEPRHSMGRVDPKDYVPRSAGSIAPSRINNFRRPGDALDYRRDIRDRDGPLSSNSADAFRSSYPKGPSRDIENDRFLQDFHHDDNDVYYVVYISF